MEKVLVVDLELFRVFSVTVSENPILGMEIEIFIEFNLIDPVFFTNTGDVSVEKGAMPCMVWPSVMADSEVGEVKATCEIFNVENTKMLAVVDDDDPLLSFVVKVTT